MPVPVTCPNCATNLRAPDNAVGRKVKCPKCGGVIAVPAAGDEPIDLAQMGVQAEPPDPVPPPPSRRPQDDYQDDDRPRARRRREEDYEDDYDDDERGSRRAGAAAQGGGLPMGLGIASLSVGILGLLIAWIPCVGALSWPICAIGLILGVVGLILGISKGNAIGFPIAGSAVSGVALAVSLMWVLFWTHTVRKAAEQVQRAGKDFGKDFERAIKEAQAAQKQQQLDIAKPIQVGKPAAPLIPATGNIELIDGKAEIKAALKVTDPRDNLAPPGQVRRCKIYTLNMGRGRTYQIDMTSATLDSFLRLEDAEGNLVRDGGEGRNARIEHRCTRAGNYRIVATTTKADVGVFTLKVQELNE
jgi:predicted Zn finger-like uncharacterized protein